MWILLIPTLLLLPKKIRLKDLFQRRDFLLLLAIVVATLIKFVLFPYTIDRYFAPFYAGAILMLIYGVAEKQKQNSN